MIIYLVCCCYTCFVILKKKEDWLEVFFNFFFHHKITEKPIVSTLFFWEYQNIIIINLDRWKCGNWGIYLIRKKKEKLKCLVKSKEDGRHRKRYFPLFFDMNMQVKFRVNSGDFIIPKYHPSAYFIKQIFYFTFVMTADDPTKGFSVTAHT